MKLPKGKFVPTKIRRGDGVRIDDYTYNLGRGGKKKDVDIAVKNKLREFLQKFGPFWVSITYYTDKDYTTDMMLIESEKDIQSIQFSERDMANYENEEMHDQNAKIRGVALAVGRLGKGKKSAKGGGASAHNDCLWDCLMKGFEKLKTPKILKTPEGFKKWLKVGRDDMISVERIPEIEDALKCNIDVAGTVEYESPKKYAMGIKLRLWNSHYQRIYGLNEYEELCKGYQNYKGRRWYPIMFKKNFETREVKICYLSQYSKGKKIVEVNPLKFLDDYGHAKEYAEMREHSFLKSVEKQPVLDKHGKQVWNPKYKNRKAYIIPEPEDVIEKKIEEYKTSVN